MSIYNDVKKIIEGSAINCIGTQKVGLLESLNHILQEDIVSDIDMPPFNKSAMDGYACRNEDLGNEMEVIEVIQAGKLPIETIKKNQCSKIMTGAAIPQGADSVFMIEDTDIINDKIVKCNNPKTKVNICLKGEDYQIGDILLKKGIKISPSHIGIMASAGYSEVLISKTPLVGIIATGTELVEPFEKPTNGQIRNSNSYQIMAQLKEIGINYNYYGTIEDDFERISDVFQKSIFNNDIIIITGGASNGDYDFVSAILKKHEFETLVEKTGIQPGNPMTFSKQLNKYCFGLSGNPLSAFIQFELFVKPFLYKIMDYCWASNVVTGTISFDFYRKKAERFSLIPVIISENFQINEIEFNGSAHINALSVANALLEVPENVFGYKKGEKVQARII